MGKSNITTLTHICACVRNNYRTKPSSKTKRATLLGMRRSTLSFVGFVVRSLLDDIRNFATADQTRFAVNLFLPHLLTPPFLFYIYLHASFIGLLRLSNCQYPLLNIGDSLGKYMDTLSSGMCVIGAPNHLGVHCILTENRLSMRIRKKDIKSRSFR